ncbi:MAG: putative poly(3-hydroxybutyrate) depolymerase [Collimonas fungivorans]|uniref:extracellular catalytic domain type 2 short-chain-length polyhydroxyalkanoate depolymerase n=1 Tax=Collimonas fungivorans TaxID=158899 RepID=UPI0026EC3593|nr:PHB depolymerase family esterase [Collimonas fungivorans]MDB5765729.1 putative poly(3-hydroxybutyrate) depolymerase [Collimonas fungivorans]
MKIFFRHCVIVFSVLLSAFSLSARAAPIAELGAYGADLRQTSVSGLSSGAFMAAQFDVAFSKELVGAGIIAGGPFYCSGQTTGVIPFIAAQTLCMQPLGSAPSAENSWLAAQKFAQQGVIDDPQHLQRHRVYIFSGTKDTTVLPKVVDETARFYALAKVPKENIQYIHDIAAGHAIITSNAGDVACGRSAAPYINDCNFEQSHQILRWIYGKMKAPAAQPKGRLLQFNQRAFDPGKQAWLSDIAYLYVPASCAAEACKVHVVFHGCGQDALAIGDRYVRTTGYNELADTNKIIVLYPQVDKSFVNPKGCWDFWGYTSPEPAKPNFYTRQAPQMAAVMQMVRQLGEKRP